MTINSNNEKNEIKRLDAAHHRLRLHPGFFGRGRQNVTNAPARKRLNYTSKKQKQQTERAWSNSVQLISS